MQLLSRLKINFMIFLVRRPSLRLSVHSRKGLFVWKRLIYQFLPALKQTFSVSSLSLCFTVQEQCGSRQHSLNVKVTVTPHSWLRELPQFPQLELPTLTAGSQRPREQQLLNFNLCPSHQAARRLALLHQYTLVLTFTIESHACNA